MKIKQIQTIVSADPRKFDECVNLHLKAGYTLVRRGPEQVGAEEWALYAEMVMLDEADMEPKEPDPPFGWDECVEIIREECKAAPGCDERCAVYAWCQKNIPETAPAPKYWSDPT